MERVANIGAVAVIVAVGLIPAIYFILSLQKTIRTAAPETVR